MQLNRCPVGQVTAQDVLLQHSIGRRHPPYDVVSQARHGPVQPLQYLQVVLDGLFDQVIVVPDDGIRSIDLAQRVDVASFQRGEETDDRVVGRKPCPSGRGKPGLRGTRSGRALRRASREIPEVSATLFDICGSVIVFTASRSRYPTRASRARSCRTAGGRKPG